MSELASYTKENRSKLEKSSLPAQNVSETLPSYLINSKKYAIEMENVHKQPFYQRNMVADLLITKGTTSYHRGYIEDATTCLEKALIVLLFVLHIRQDNHKSNRIILSHMMIGQEKRLLLKEYIPNDSQEKNVFLKQKLTIFNILLFCYLEIKNYHDAHYVCEESLKLDPNQIQITYFKQLISFIDGRFPDKTNYSLLKDLKSSYLLLDEKFKSFVQSKFVDVVDSINSLDESVNRAIKYREETENSYQLPTTNASVKPMRDDPQAINSQQFLVKLPFWVSVIVIVMILSTYFF